MSLDGRTPKSRSLARWSVIFAVNGALLLVVGVSTVRETYREWRVDQEIRQMQSQIESLEGKKLAFSDLIKRMESDDALDREARTRLGLRKPDERVIILRGAGADSWQDDSFAQDAEESPAEPQSNPQRWFSHFFPMTQ